MAITKAVIPAAGMGTRFLPATKTTPKEMLPVVDQPAIAYVAEEASSAGLKDMLVITGRTKKSLEDYFDASPELEPLLTTKGDDARLDAIRSPETLGTFFFVRQGQPKGLGHAVLCAKDHIGQESFAVLLGDDLIDARDPLLPDMIALAERTGACVVALLEVPAEQIHLYGSAAVSPIDFDFTPQAATSGDVVRVHGLVEKPAAEDAPSNLAVIGRYVLTPQVFDVLENTAPGRGGEIQLTDALATLAADPDGPGVYGIVFRGRRYDTGDKLSYLETVVQLACDREDLGPAFREWLTSFTAGL